MDTEKLFLTYEKEVAEFKLKLIRRMSEGALPHEEQSLKRTSKISIVESILARESKPLHVDEIISVAEKEFNVTLDKDSLSSALTKKTLKDERFIRVAPNTFELRQD